MNASSILDGLAAGADGLVTLAIESPGQAVRILRAFTPEERAAIFKRLPIPPRVRAVFGLGDTMNGESYYYNPALFKMPAYYRRPVPPLGAFKEGSLTKALPFIALGIVAIVGYNMFVKKPKRKNPCRRRNITAAKRRSIKPGKFAYPEEHKLPIDTKKRTRSAMSRFSQTDFVSKAAKKRAFKRIVRRADNLGIDPSGFESRWGRL